MNPPKVVVRALARQDIENQYCWLSNEAGIDVADRFLVAADRAFAVLAQQPGLGPALMSENARIAGLRKWKVDGFPNIVIFYEPRETGISVVRVIHAAQDWWRLIDS